MKKALFYIVLLTPAVGSAASINVSYQSSALSSPVIVTFHNSNSLLTTAKINQAVKAISGYYTSTSTARLNLQLNIECTPQDYAAPTTSNELSAFLDALALKVNVPAFSQINVDLGPVTDLRNVCKALKLSQIQTPISILAGTSMMPLSYGGVPDPSQRDIPLSGLPAVSITGGTVPYNGDDFVFFSNLLSFTNTMIIPNGTSTAPFTVGSPPISLSSLIHCSTYTPAPITWTWDYDAWTNYIDLSNIPSDVTRVSSTSPTIELVKSGSAFTLTTPYTSHLQEILDNPVKFNTYLDKLHQDGEHNLLHIGSRSPLEDAEALKDFLRFIVKTHEETKGEGGFRKKITFSKDDSRRPVTFKKSDKRFDFLIPWNDLNHSDVLDFFRHPCLCESFLTGLRDFLCTSLLQGEKITCPPSLAHFLLDTFEDAPNLYERSDSDQLGLTWNPDKDTPTVFLPMDFITQRTETLKGNKKLDFLKQGEPWKPEELQTLKNNGIHTLETD